MFQEKTYTLIDITNFMYSIVSCNSRKMNSYKRTCNMSIYYKFLLHISTYVFYSHFFLRIFHFSFKYIFIFNPFASVQDT